MLNQSFLNGLKKPNNFTSKANQKTYIINLNNVTIFRDNNGISANVANKDINMVIKIEDDGVELDVITKSNAVNFEYEEALTRFCDQNFVTLQKDCQKKKKLFEDSEFPPPSKKSSVVWRRPHEISTAPEFVNKEMRFDAIQGKLDDCWLIVGMDHLAAREKLFYQ